MLTRVEGRYRVIVRWLDKELENRPTWMAEFFSHFEIFIRHSSGGTEENHRESQFLMPVSRLRFEAATCPVEIRFSSSNFLGDTMLIGSLVTTSWSVPMNWVSCHCFIAHHFLEWVPSTMARCNRLQVGAISPQDEASSVPCRYGMMRLFWSGSLVTLHEAFCKVGLFSPINNAPVTNPCTFTFHIHL